MTDNRDDEPHCPKLAVLVLVIFAFLIGLAIGRPASCGPYHPDHISLESPV